jgi:hypothetical protein
VRKRLELLSGNEKMAAVLKEYDRQLNERFGAEKVAAGWRDLPGQIAEGAGKAYRTVADNEVGGAALKGLGYATGASVPLGLLGYGLLGSAEERAKQMAMPMMAAGAISPVLGGIGEAIGEKIVGG